jgi:fucose permease
VRVPGRADPRLLDIGAFMALFVVGMYAGAFGPVLPFLAEDVGVSLDTSGLVLTALFAGSITASALVAVALHGRDARLLTVAGMVAIVGGLLLLGFAPTWELALAAGALIGAGDGLVIAALHILMSRTAADVPHAINRLNLYFAFGAIAGPAWTGAVLATSGERWIAYAAMAAVAAVATVVLIAAEAPMDPHVDASGEGLRLPSSATTWIMGLVLFLYVGAEFGLGSWVSTYVRETADAGVFAGALLASGYWAALAGGRLLSAAWFRRGREPALLLTASAGAAGVCALVLALVSGDIVLSAVAAFGVGLCLGPVWPSVLAIASEGAPATETASTVTIGNTGGLAIPWAQGRVLVGSGPAEGVVVTAALCGVMFLIAGAYRLRGLRP